MDTLKLLSRSSGLKFGRTADPQSSTIQPLPSAGGPIQEGTSKKRKRAVNDDGPLSTPLTESDIRQIQKNHKIKITDLRKSQNLSKHENRKAQKEASRLFPQPLQSFSELNSLGVNRALTTNVADQAFTEPTEVQLAAIPLLLARGDDEPDLLTVAPTGSGKTLAFLIPLINKIVKIHYESQVEERHVSAIILAPTKELVNQIVNEGRKLIVNTGVKITEMRKGMKLYDDHNINDDGSSDGDSDHDQASSGTTVKSDILVSTPLSLVNVLTTKENETKSLPSITNLVLDEADVLLDPLFRDQTLTVWKACTSSNLRCSLWSATIGASIEELAISTISNHTNIHSPRVQHPLIRTIIGLKDTSLPSINHRLIYASTESGKLMGLRQLLHPVRANTKNPTPSEPLRPPFIIFTQTIDRAQALYSELQYDIPPSAGNTRIAVLHSSLSTRQRQDTMSGFRQGKIWILITTDLLSRGVDFRGVNGIVNYDIPTTQASYVHRAGRTGRAGRGGTAVTFYTRDDIKYLKPIANIIRSSQGEGGVPDWLIPALPDLNQSSRRDLKLRGVSERRAIKNSDDDKERRRKLQNRIGTQSGYDRKLAHRQQGMIQGSKRRARREKVNDMDKAARETEVEFEGFD